MRTKPDIRQAIEKLFAVHVTGVWTSNQRGKAKRMGQTAGRKAHWKKAVVTLRAGETATRSRSSRADPWAFVNSSRSRRARASARSRISRDHAVDAREVAARADQEVGRTRQPRPHLDASHRRRSQAHVPRDRLQAQQVRRSGTVREIEYDPNRSARIALIEYADGEKRYILHPKGLSQGDTIVSGPGIGHAVGQRAAAARDPARYGRAQHRAQDRQGRPDGALGRHVGRSSRRKASTSRCVWARARCAWCTATAWRRSAKSATRSTSCSRAARRARRAGRASVRRCAAK
jgi:hypothetical protein